MQKNKKILLIITIAITLIILPNLGVINFDFFFDNNYIDEINTLKKPKKSDVSYVDLTGDAHGVYIRGDYAYVAVAFDGLAIINISDPLNPGTPVYMDTNGHAWYVYVSGDYAYLALDSYGLAIIDISDPTNPGPPDYVDTKGVARTVCVSGDYAYLADEWAGLAIINVSDPTNPGTPDYVDTDGQAFGVYVSGNYAYVGDQNSGLAIIDVSDPTNPGTPDYVDTDGHAWGVFVNGDYAYVADRYSGLAIINVSDPTNPGTLVYEDTNEYAMDVYVSGDYAYVTDTNSGLAIINVSDPTNPGTPFYIDTDGLARKVFKSGDYAYIADTNSGLAVIDVSDPFDPIITDAPSNFVMESGYIGASISWTATDSHPNNYTIELQGSGIVAGPTAWSSGAAITYIIPSSLAVGEHIYAINITDDNCNYVIGNVTITVEDTADPIILGAPSNFSVESGYIGVNTSWTATDPNSNTYTIDLQGFGLVVSPTAWSSGVEITYDIPDGLAVGEYVYTVNFTDDYGHFITDSVTMTIQDTTDPIITDAPNDLIIEYGYTGVNIPWIGMDPNPHTYTIELQGFGIVAGPSAWSSGVTITYNLPDGLLVGQYLYTINVTDDFNHFITDSAVITIEDTTDPIITNAPSDFTLESVYTGKSISWTATDLQPHTYTIELQGSATVVGPTAWSSGVAIIYNVPDGLAVGEYIYTVNFTDLGGNFITDSVTFTVEETINPIIASAPSNLILEAGYSGESLSWTATDANPDIYTIELQGSGIVAGPTSWTSGVIVTYDIPDGFAPGVYTYNITFKDETGNSISNTVTVTIPKGGVPIGNFFLIFIGLSVICLIFIKKRQIIREDK